MLTRQDFVRRAAAQLLESPDTDLHAVANEVFARLTPTVTNREAYGSAEIALAAATVFLQLTELAYTIVAESRRGSDAEDLANQLRTAAEAMAEMAKYNRIDSHRTEAMIKAISSAMSEVETETAADEADA
jgi:hypothetical protein